MGSRRARPYEKARKVSYLFLLICNKVLLPYENVSKSHKRRSILTAVLTKKKTLGNRPMGSILCRLEKKYLFGETASIARAKNISSFASFPLWASRY